jgi:hypothetical protein
MDERVTAQVDYLKWLKATKSYSFMYHLKGVVLFERFSENQKQNEYFGIISLLKSDNSSLVTQITTVIESEVGIFR